MLIVYVKVTNHMFNEKKRNVIKESGNILWFRLGVRGRGRREIIQFLFIIIYESLKHDVITMRKHQKGYKKKVKILNIHTHILTTMMMMMLYDLLVYYNLNYTTYSIATTITLIERVWFNGMIPCYYYYYHNLFFSVLPDITNMAKTDCISSNGYKNKNRNINEWIQFTN